jgi:DNA-binding MarR family transcriptional regulator
MAAKTRARLIQDVLGSAYILSSAVNDLMETRLHAVTREQLTFSQLKLLKLVSRTDSYNISQVAAFLTVSTAAASKAVDRLVRRGLLIRSEAEDDRRAVELSLTSEGRRMLEEYEKLTVIALDEIFGGYSPEDLRGAAELLDRLSVNVLTHDGESAEVCYRCGIYFRDKCLLRAVSGRECHVFSREGARGGGNGDESEVK